MKKAPFMLAVMLVLGSAITLSACGVPQKDVDTLKSQLDQAQKEAAQAKQDLATAKKASVWSIIPNAPPRAAPPPPTPGAPPPPPPPTPPPPTTVPVFMYVDTVTAGPGESKYNVDPSRNCIISSVFERGQHVVWRMRAVDSTGRILQKDDVKSAVVKFGSETRTFNFGRHGANADSPWFWTASFDLPTDYPLGVIDFTVEMTTNDGKTGTFKQLPVSAGPIESRLQVVE